VVGFDRVERPADLADDDGPFALWAVADQTARASVEDAFGSVVEQLGVPTVIVANAGYAKFGGWLEMSPRDFERHVGVNLVGTFHVVQSAARHMRDARSEGAVTIISSSLGLYHSDQVGAYCVTKAALLSLTRSMAAELGVHCIRVNSILPGVVETSMTQLMLDEPGVRDDLLDQTPLGRLGRPSDIADAVAFLSSDASAWVTGATMTVDGGQSMYTQPQWIKQLRTTPHEPNWVPGLGNPTRPAQKENV
jgi:NAD(P)-dependent dehydrogenase (short-subunit alcohol dehydrogenase family)